MQLTYKYRLKPTKPQLATISTHLTVAEIQPTDKNALGIDLGITSYAYL
ncbi:hypothetical protein [Microcoleus sp. CAWBG640]